MRVFHGLMALLFVVAVVVQWNDPDPIPWVLMYGAAASLAAMGTLGIPPRETAVFLGLIASLWAASLLPSAVKFDASTTEWQMKAGDIIEEEARECGGLLLVTVSAVALVMDANRRRRSSVPR